MRHLLLIDDDQMSRAAAVHSLESDFIVTTCASLTEGKTLLEKKSFDLILLDLVLPDGDGLQLLSTMKNSSRYKRTPIIVITSKSATPDHVMGLSLGADDYIIKPIDPLLLKARVESRLKHFEESKRDEDIVRLKDLRLNIHKQKLFILTNDHETEVELTSLEFKMLLHFMKHEEIVLSREQLISTVWGDQVHIIDRTVDGHVSHLRKKISESSYTIEPVRGEGYRLALKI